MKVEELTEQRGYFRWKLNYWTEEKFIFCAFPQKKPFDKKARASAHTNSSREKGDMQEPVSVYKIGFLSFMAIILYYVIYKCEYVRLS